MLKLQAGIDDRPHVTALDRERRQRRRHVEHGERLRRVLDVVGRGHHARQQPFENVEFKPERAVGGAGDALFEIGEFGGGEAHLARERLAVDEGRVQRRGHQLVAVLRRDLDEIAEHVVVADLQSANLRLVGVARLQRGDDAARLVAQARASRRAWRHSPRG